MAAAGRLTQRPLSLAHVGPARQAGTSEREERACKGPVAALLEGGRRVVPTARRERSEASARPALLGRCDRKQLEGRPQVVKEGAEAGVIHLQPRRRLLARLELASRAHEHRGCRRDGSVVVRQPHLDRVQEGELKGSGALRRLSVLGVERADAGQRLAFELDHRRPSVARVSRHCGGAEARAKPEPQQSAGGEPAPGVPLQ